MRKPPPDFLIVGAPKCGTTAIYKALRQHPEVFLPPIKEPHYFASEYGDRRAVENLRAYDELFTPASADQLRGEASVMYLSSSEAIPAVLERRPDVRMIAVVRNPLDLFISWHNQCLRSLDEDVTDPETAWRLQEERMAGRSIPARCHEPLSLQYRRICSLGAQIQRLCDLVPARQRLVLVFDDIELDPGGTWRNIARFLEVTDDLRTELSRENSFARPRNTAVALLARSFQVNHVLKNLRLRIKPFLNRHGVFFVEKLLQRNLAPARKPTLRPEFARELRTVFAPEVHLLESLLDRDLSHWKSEPAVAPALKRASGI